MHCFGIRAAGLLAFPLCWGLVSSASAQSTPTAEYEVVFDSTWSRATHPQDFPSNPHFSPMIGGTHNGQAVFWAVGGLATLGIERMAELGATSTLSGEIQSEISAGNADAVVSGGGIGNSPGSVSVAFTAREDFPQLTLVSMLAPSPDWFVGVGGLALVQSGEWVDQLIVPLHVYDAGTDSGVSYTSPDADMDPADPIAQLNSGLFAPPGDVVGTFTITRTDLPLPVPSVSRSLLPLLAGALIVAGAYRLRLRRRADRKA